MMYFFKRRHLDVRCLALDDPDGVACALGGAASSVASPLYGERVAQESRRKACGVWAKKDCPADPASCSTTPPATCLTVSRASSAASAAPDSAAAAIVFARRPTAAKRDVRRLANGHDIRGARTRAGTRRPRNPDGVRLQPPRAAASEGVEQARLRILDQLLRQRDDDLVDVRVLLQTGTHSVRGLGVRAPPRRAAWVGNDQAADRVRRRRGWLKQTSLEII